MHTLRVIIELTTTIFLLACITDLVFHYRKNLQCKTQENLASEEDYYSSDNGTDPYREIAILKSRLAQLRMVAKSVGTVQGRDDPQSLPKIYVVTPTFARPHQKAELTRFSHTLLLVPRIHWILVEDSKEKTSLVQDLLSRSGLDYTHLNVYTPDIYKKPPNNTAKGVLQRNAALDWIRTSAAEDQDGLLYFADDDNSYSLQLFEEIRSVKTVGVWPVGLVGGVMVERPVLDERGKVAGWAVGFGKYRKFALDMAAFAVNLKLIHGAQDAKFSYSFPKCNQENRFLQFFVKDLGDLEVKACNCSKVLVWHTRTSYAPLDQENKLKRSGKPPTNLGIEV